MQEKVLDEESIIKLLWKKLGATKPLSDPFNDDAAWVRNPSGKRLVVAKSDMLVGITDSPNQMSASQIAQKSIVSCVSDFAAKGVKPTFCLVSVGLPRRKASRKFVSGLSSGFALAQKQYGVRIIGGDTNETNSDLVIDCSMFGFANQLVTRRGAKPGHLVGVSGMFGHQSSGLLILLWKKMRVNDVAFGKKAINSVLNPSARLGLGLKLSRYLSSCIDSSDGLSISLYHLAESSSVNIEIQHIPIEPRLGRFAKDNGLEENDLALYGGEEFELVFSFAPRYRKILSRMGVITIGKVSPKSRKERPSVFYKSRKVPRRGWIHFQQ